MTALPVRLLLVAAVTATLCACTEAPTPLLVAPTSLHFGDVPTGASFRQVVALRNPGADVREVSLSVPSPFFATFTQASLPPGATVQIPVAFRPLTEGNHAAELVLRSDHQTLSLPVRGAGVAPADNGCGTPPTCMVYERSDAGCQTVPAPEGTVCSTRCAPEGLCVAGVCEGFSPECDDRNACTQDSCQELFGCQNVFVQCEAASACEAAVCDPVKGCATTPVVDGTPCGSTECGAVDLCQSGQCTRFEQTTPNCSLDVCGRGRDFNECTLALCPENPLPATGAFVDGHARGPHDVWFANRLDGNIYHFDGGSFSPVLSPGGQLTGVLARSANDLWVTARDRPPRRWNGSQWTEFGLPNQERCYSIAPLANGQVACAGPERVYILDNSGAASAIGSFGYSIVREGGGKTWSVSYSGEVRRVLGTAGMTVVGNLPGGLRDFTVDSQGRAWILGDPQLSRFDDTGTKNINLPFSVDLLGSAGKRVIAWSFSGNVFSIEGPGIKQLPGLQPTSWGDSADLVTGANENDLWLQGEQLMHYDGVTLSPVGCGVDNVPFDHIRATADGGGFAASGSQLYRRDRRAWVHVPIAGLSAQLRDVHAVSSDEAYVVADDRLLRRVRLDGGSVAPLVDVTAVWGSSPTDLWAGTSNANQILHHYDGVTWTALPQPDGGLSGGHSILSLHGSGPDDVWALGTASGNGAFVWRWDGVRWMDEGLPRNFNTVTAVRRSGGVTRVAFPYQRLLYSKAADAGWTSRFTPSGMREAFELNGRVIGVNSDNVIYSAVGANAWEPLFTLPLSLYSLSPLDNETAFVSGNGGYIAKIRVPQ